jgi:hypothetical protein
MTPQIELDSMSIEDLVDLGERVQKKINEKISAEKSELEKRQAALPSWRIVWPARRSSRRRRDRRRKVPARTPDPVAALATSPRRREAWSHLRSARQIPPSQAPSRRASF